MTSIFPQSASASPSANLLEISPREVGPALGSPEDRALRSVALPLCDGLPCGQNGSDLSPQAVGKRKIFLNFEGVTLTSSTQNDDATSNTSYIIKDTVAPGSTITISAFSRFDLGSQSGATSRQEIIDYTIQKMREYHAPYNFEFTTVRPSSGPYNMIVFGGNCASVAGTNCAGIALLDCSDSSPSNIVFAFPPGLRAVDLATTATQEMAHALGLTHTLDTSDFMYPTIRSTLPTHFGAGAIPNQDQSGCSAGSYQDSHQKMLSIVGPPGSDSMPPFVQITSPSNGDVVKVGDIVLTTITDESPISSVEFSIDGTVLATKSSGPYNFPIPSNASLGQVRVDVRATDGQGNEAGSKVTVIIGTGNEEPCNAGQCAEGFSCTDSFCYPDSPVDPAPPSALGEVCTDNESCESGTCAELQSQKRCSQVCDSENTCPEGFACLGGTACWPIGDNTGGSSGVCAIAQPGAGGLGSLAFLCFALLLGGRRRNFRRGESA